MISTGIPTLKESEDNDDENNESLDCRLLNIDGNKPAIFKEADPGHIDILFCLTDDDQRDFFSDADSVAISSGTRSTISLGITFVGGHMYY